MMPILQVAWLLLSMVSGSLYFQETTVMNTLQIIMFIVGTVVLLAGLLLITTSSKPKADLDSTAKDAADLEQAAGVEGDISKHSSRSSKQDDAIKIGDSEEESERDSFSIEESGVPVGRKGTHQPENAVSRRHTYAVAAHGGLPAAVHAGPVVVVRPPSRRESRDPAAQEESTVTKVQRAVTAPLSGVIW